jgi:hypothetical protein
MHPDLVRSSSSMSGRSLEGAHEGSTAGAGAIDRYHVKDYRNLDVDGRLYLWFYDGKLGRAEFLPVDGTTYGRRLSESLKVPETALSHEVELGAIRVWSGVSRGGEVFFGWRDEDLVRHFDTYDGS